MFELDKEHIFYLFNLIAETSRQLSLSNPDYALEIATFPVESLYLEAIDLRTRNRYRYTISNFVLMERKEPVGRMAERISRDICNELNFARIKGK